MGIFYIRFIEKLLKQLKMISRKYENRKQPDPDTRIEQRMFELDIFLKFLNLNIFKIFFPNPQYGGILY